jgi:hypothetical protein
MFAYQKHGIEILCMVLRWKRKNRHQAQVKKGVVNEKGALITNRMEEGTSIWEEEWVAHPERERERERERESRGPRLGPI